MTPGRSIDDLRSILERHRRRYHTPPDGPHVKDFASVFGMAVAEVQDVIEAIWNPLPPAVELSEPVHPIIARSARQADTEHPFDRVLAALRARGCRILPKPDARGRESRRATCPSHDDRNPSLIVTADGPNVLLHCFGGCLTARIVAALGLKLADLFSGPRQPGVRRRHPRAPKPPAAPKLSPEQRLARKRMLTAARTRRWRERSRTSEPPVTHQNIRSVTCDAVTLGDAPNVDPFTSHDEFSYVSSDLVATPTMEEGPLSIEISVSLCRELSFDLEIHRGHDHDGGDDDDEART